jgi:serine protease Do
MIFRQLYLLRYLLAFSFSCVVFGATAQDPATPPLATPAAALPVTPGGEAIYSMAKSRLFQIRTLLTTTGNQSSIGSGFAVSADGLLITNYHVISQVALEPGTYRLEYLAPDGTKGNLVLQGFDVVNDVAVVRLDKPAATFFEFSPRALLTEANKGLQKGERVYSMGNPLDLGFTITEGTYNSLVQKSYGDRIHFSGALNPGMSGGPAVDSKGQVVGVNVSKQLGQDLVSFLVPAKFAQALLQRVKGQTPIDAKQARAEMARQLTDYQAQFLKDLRAVPTKTSKLGTFEVKEPAAGWLTCWARSNAEEQPKPRFSLSMNNCSANAGIYLAGDLMTGRYRYAHSLFSNGSLNSLQFPKLLRDGPKIFGASQARVTPVQCQQTFLSDGAPGAAQRVTLCARGYRDFEGLFDFSVSVISQTKSPDALQSDMSVQAVTWANGQQLMREFVKSIGLAAPTIQAVPTKS